MNSFSRSWMLTRQSFSVLSKNPVLMVFPCLSAAATLLVIGSFLLPLFHVGAFQTLAHAAEHRGQAGHVDPGMFLMMLLFYFCCYFVQTFFNCALMASANMVLCGGRTTLKDGLSLAASRVAAIAGWALLAATVGVLLKTLQERAGVLGKIVIALMGAAWSILTYFIGPVIIFEGEGLLEGVRRSGALVKKTWGEGLSHGVTFFALNILASIGLIVSSIILIMLNPIAGVLWAVVYVSFWAIIVSAANGIFRVALYRYAWISDKTEQFDPELVERAFVQKQKRV